VILNFFFKIIFFLLIKTNFLIYTFILFTILYGAHISFIQKKIKRYWAYSKINNFGFFFFSTFFCNFFWGLQLGLFFIITYIFMTFFFFFILFYTRNILTGNILFYFLHIVFIKNKLVILALSLLFFSLAGLPPFIGFFSKFFIFTGIIFINHIYLIIFFIIYSLYSAVYYLRIIKQLFFLQTSKKNIQYIFYTNMYLKIIFNSIMIILFSSFKSTSFIFKLCYLYILQLTTV
jgi:NADH:ubiquinone oxidoreductase subunit 2 (subunit N)